LYSNALIRHKRIETPKNGKFVLQNVQFQRPHSAQKDWNTFPSNGCSRSFVIPTPSFGTKGLKQYCTQINILVHEYSNALIRHKRIETKVINPLSLKTWQFQRPHSAQKDWNEKLRTILEVLTLFQRPHSAQKDWNGIVPAFPPSLWTIPTPSFGTKGLKLFIILIVIFLALNSNALIRHKRIETTQFSIGSTKQRPIPTPSFGTKGLKRDNRKRWIVNYDNSNALIRHKRIETQSVILLSPPNSAFQRPHSAQKDWNSDWH